MQEWKNLNLFNPTTSDISVDIDMSHMSVRIIPIEIESMTVKLTDLYLDMIFDVNG